MEIDGLSSKFFNLNAWHGMW